MDQKPALIPDPPLTRDTYVVATVRCLWENLPRLVIAGLGFSVLAAPSFVLGVLGLWGPALLAGLLLVGPGWVALLQWEGELLAGRTPSWTALGRNWLRYWLPSVRLGMLALFPPALAQVWSERLPAHAPLWLLGLHVAAWLYA
ncbi:MAG TPA: hypothetical protein VNK95_03725, partial [Caldilineaceae bacterium]|nr:hypothetical protein [Caldilineaceae bacterium]